MRRRHVPREAAGGPNAASVPERVERLPHRLERARRRDPIGEHAQRSRPAGEQADLQAIAVQTRLVLEHAGRRPALRTAQLELAGEVHVENLRIEDRERCSDRREATDELVVEASRRLAHAGRLVAEPDAGAQPARLDPVAQRHATAGFAPGGRRRRQRQSFRSFPRARFQCWFARWRWRAVAASAASRQRRRTGDTVVGRSTELSRRTRRRLTAGGRGVSIEAPTEPPSRTLAGSAFTILAAAGGLLTPDGTSGTRASFRIHPAARRAYCRVGLHQNPAPTVLRSSTSTDVFGWSTASTGARVLRRSITGEGCPPTRTLSPARLNPLPISTKATDVAIRPQATLRSRVI